MKRFRHAHFNKAAHFLRGERHALKSFLTLKSIYPLWLVPLLASSVSTQALAQKPPSILSTPAESNADQFQFLGRSATNLQLFERQLLPGPAGSIVDQQLVAPIHQSVSLRALGVDSPISKDSLEIQVAGFGQLVPGADAAVQPATWDVASAFIKQDWEGASLTVGRQVMAGGAARYSRFDGGKLAIKTAFGLELVGYGGLTAVPRWNSQYGYHQLGYDYETLSTQSNASLKVDRFEQWMGGVNAQFRNAKIGSIGVSFHQQAESAVLYRSTLGMEANLSAIKGLDLSGSALLSTDSGRFSDIRAAAVAQAWKNPSSQLIVRADFLHTIPSLLLSQSSVFSVFSYEEITEMGGEADLKLPAGFAVEASAHGQMYQEGPPGMRAQASVSFVSDEDRTFFTRLVVGGLDNEENGYIMLRASASYRMREELTALVDVYHYQYKAAIQGTSASSFYAAHLAYQASSAWSGRIGTSLTQSPYARYDLQALAKIEYQFDARQW